MVVTSYKPTEDFRGTDESTDSNVKLSQNLFKETYKKVIKLRKETKMINESEKKDIPDIIYDSYLKKIRQQKR